MSRQLMQLRASGAVLILVALAACSRPSPRPADEAASTADRPLLADQDQAMASAVDAVLPFLPADSLPVCLSLPPLDTDSLHRAESVVPHLRGARAVRPASRCPADAGSGPAAYLLSPATAFYDLPDSLVVRMEVMRSFEVSQYRCTARPSPAGPRSTCAPLPPGA